MVNDTPNTTKWTASQQAEVRPMTREEGRKAIEVMEAINRENAMKRVDGSAKASPTLREQLNTVLALARCEELAMSPESHERARARTERALAQLHAAQDALIAALAKAKGEG